MAVTTEQLNAIKADLENGGMLRKYLQDNNIQENPQEVRQAFETEFGQGSFRTAMQTGQSQRMLARQSQMIDRLDTTEKCDNMITNLNQRVKNINNLITQVNAKKTELQG